MKAVGLHPDVFVVTSRFWQTTCTLLKSGDAQSASRAGEGEAFCVDSPVLPDELELLISFIETQQDGKVGRGREALRGKPTVATPDTPEAGSPRLRRAA